MTSRALDITNQRYGRLIAIEPFDKLKNGMMRWTCKCDCGEEAVVQIGHLRNGKVKSCGCGRVDFATNQRTHGMTKTPTYLTWKSMKARCNNPNSPDYKDYGERGITVCARWDEFENFLADMGARPAGRTIDRKDTNGNYEPDNCRWATPVEQANNRRR